MIKVQKESLLLAMFMATLFLIAACETGGSKDTQEEEREMIEGEDRMPAREDTLKDSLEIEPLDSADISEVQNFNYEEFKYHHWNVDPKRKLAIWIES